VDAPYVQGDWGTSLITMFLIQILVPANDGPVTAGQPNPFAQMREELKQKFGGLTVYSRAPAEGLWQEDENHTVQDNIVLFEIMADTLDRAWWAAYRRILEVRFDQQEIVIRAQEIERL
jgi:hypothetical protein